MSPVWWRKKLIIFVHSMKRQIFCDNHGREPASYIVFGAKVCVKAALVFAIEGKNHTGFTVCRIVNVNLSWDFFTNKMRVPNKSQQSCLIPRDFRVRLSEKRKSDQLAGQGNFVSYILSVNHQGGSSGVYIAASVVTAVWRLKNLVH